jgi:6-phosphogluconate dehydrogenase
MMASFAEGLNIMKHVKCGSDRTEGRCGDGAIARPGTLPVPVRPGRSYRGVAARQRNRLWLLDLTAAALFAEPDMAAYKGSVADSGEGRWTLAAAIEESVPAPVLSAALFQRFSTRGESDFANKLLSAMRSEFGGHAERR